MPSLPPLEQRLPENLTTIYALFSAPERSEDLFVVLFWTFISLYGWVTNTIVMISILTTTDLRKRSCYWLIFSSCICDVTMLITYFVLILPLFAVHERFYDVYSDINFIAFYIYQVFFYSGFLLLIATGINRLFCIAFPMIYTTFFTFNRTAALSFGCICLGFAAATVNILPCCRAYTDPVTYTTVYPEESWFIEYDLSLTLTLCACSVSLYVAILYFVRRHARKVAKNILSPLDTSRVNNRRTEIILTIQCAVICGFNIAASSSWDIVPMISDTKLTFIVLNSLFLLNNCTSSTVHLLTNSRLRAGIKRNFSLEFGESSFLTRLVARRNPNASA